MRVDRALVLVLCAEPLGTFLLVHAHERLTHGCFRTTQLPWLAGLTHHHEHQPGHQVPQYTYEVVRACRRPLAHSVPCIVIPYRTSDCEGNVDVEREDTCLVLAGL